MISYDFLKKFLDRKENESAKKTAIQAKGCKVFRRFLIEEKVYNVIAFDSRKIAELEPCLEYMRYIPIGDYLLCLEGTSKEEITFNRMKLYNISEGTCVQEKMVDFPDTKLAQLLIIDERVFALCGNDFPRFAIVVNNRLTEIASSTVEQILHFHPMTPKQQASLIRFNPSAGWEYHNNVMINPQTLTVPGALDVTFWNQRRPRHKEIYRKIETQLLARALNRPQTGRPAVHYISSDNFILKKNS